ncbi:MAG: AAA family ATPase [Acidimicrobiia bacterium]|nr:AAA family ATPase [Acidimicrobiia bacterium]
MSTISMPVSTCSPEVPFPVRRIDEIELQDPETLWLIEDLWLREGVGLLGAPPKHFKTWLASDIAFSVATGTPALGRYRVCEPGAVLFFGAEDSSPSLRTRFDCLAQSRGLSVEGIPLYLLDINSLRLENPKHLRRLEATLDEHRPRLLVLDPLVRVACVDENSAAEVSTVLGSLRELQRRFHVAVLLVHHTRKASGSSPTQALRGSGDFGAWSDSNLIIRSRKDDLVLTLEHRSAPAPDPLVLRFLADPIPHFSPVSRPAAGDPASRTAQAPDLAAVLLACLPKIGAARPTVDLREQVGRRKTDVLEALRHLKENGLVERIKEGWRRTPGTS